MKENSKLPPQRRLCSEIQLFDLCDLAGCSRLNGRYCTNEELLARFEKFEDDDPMSPENYLAGGDEQDDQDDRDDDGDYEGEGGMREYEEEYEEDISLQVR